MYNPDLADKLEKYDNLYFSNNNGKLRKTSQFTGYKKDWSYTFSLPAGFTCPFAGTCINYCYALWNNNFRHEYNNCNKHNYYLIYNNLINNGVNGAINIILQSIPSNAHLIRINESGDYFLYKYLLAWSEVAKIRKDIIFYSYTKSLPYLYQFLSRGGELSDNFKIVMSLDCSPEAKLFIPKLKRLGVRAVHILRTEEDYYNTLELPFNNNERESIYGSGDFKIAIHGAINRFKIGTPEYHGLRFFNKLQNTLDVSIC